MEQSLQNNPAAYKPSVEAVKIEIHKPTVSSAPGADNGQNASQGYSYPQYQLMPGAGPQSGMIPVPVAGAGQPVYNQYYMPQNVSQRPVYNQYTMPPALPQAQLLSAPAVPSFSGPQSLAPVYNQYFLSNPLQAAQQPAPPPYPMMYPMIIPQYIPMPMQMSNCCCHGGCNCNHQQPQSALPAQGLGHMPDKSFSPVSEEQDPLATQPLQPQNGMMPQDQPVNQNMQPPMQPPPPGAQPMQPQPPNNRQKPQETQTRTRLSNEYIKSLENYLNNPNSDVRQTAIKDILKILRNDKEKYKDKDNDEGSLRRDPALTNLINKALQDRSMINRTLALSILYGDYIDGDELTIKLLKDMQKSNKTFNQDAHTANELLLRRMGEAGKIEEPMGNGFAMPGQPIDQGFNPQMPTAQPLQNLQVQGAPPLEQNFNSQTPYPYGVPQMQGPQIQQMQGSPLQGPQMQNPNLQSPQGQNLNIMSR